VRKSENEGMLNARLVSCRLCKHVLPATVIAMLLVGCTSSGVASRPGKAGSATASGRNSTQPNGTATSPAAPAGESALTCGNYVDGKAAPAAPLRVVLGVVALPASPGYPALGTSLSGDSNRALRLFAKTGLVIRPGATFELIVPAPFANRLSIGWGKPGTPSHRVIVNNCSGPGGGWLAYAGGYWIDQPACVPIIVRTGSKQTEVHIGVGTPCPGQRPPQGPSQS
jgi:hypothetical protein